MADTATVAQAKPIVLTNDFHSTRTTLAIALGDHVSRRTLRAIKRRLCPPADCTCSDPFGARPSSGLWAAQIGLDEYVIRAHEAETDNGLGREEETR